MQSMAASPEREQAATAPFPFLPSQGMCLSASPRTPPLSRGDTYYEKTDFGLVHCHCTRTQSLRAVVETAAALTLGSLGSWISSSLGTHPARNTRRAEAWQQRRAEMGHTRGGPGAL